MVKITISKLFIQLVREKNESSYKNKRDKIKIFIWVLIDQKRINDSNMIYNYCFSYYKVCKNVIYEAVQELKEKKIINSIAKLGDSRKNLLFL